MSTLPTTWFATTSRAGMWPSTSSGEPKCWQTGSPSRRRHRRSRLSGLATGLLKNWARLGGAPFLETPCWGSTEAPWRHWRRLVAQLRFRGSVNHRVCCGPVSAVDGCASVHLLGNGNVARLRGAPNRGTAGWDRPGALKNSWRRPVEQPRVGSPCRFLSKATLAWSSRPTAPTGRVDFGANRFLRLWARICRPPASGQVGLLGPNRFWYKSILVGFGTEQ